MKEIIINILAAIGAITVLSFIFCVIFYLKYKYDEKKKDGLETKA